MVGFRHHHFVKKNWTNDPMQAEGNPHGVFLVMKASIFDLIKIFVTSNTHILLIHISIHPTKNINKKKQTTKCKNCTKKLKTSF